MSSSSSSNPTTVTDLNNNNNNPQYPSSSSSSSNVGTYLSDLFDNLLQRLSSFIESITATAATTSTPVIRNDNNNNTDSNLTLQSTSSAKHQPTATIGDTTTTSLSTTKMAPTTTDKKPIIIFIIGGPGSGKGTICDLLKEKYSFTHLSTGDLLREEVASGSERGKQLNEVMASGKLVSNDQVLELLQAAIESRSNTATGFLIDGYPREVNQAIDFEQKICPCSVILYFECSDTAMTARLLNRGKTSGRVDDNEETIKRRLETFHTHTKPILDYFAERGKLEKVNTDQPVDQVYATVEPVVQRLIGK